MEHVLHGVVMCIVIDPSFREVIRVAVHEWAFGGCQPKESSLVEQGIRDARGLVLVDRYMLLYQPLHQLCA